MSKTQVFKTDYISRPLYTAIIGFAVTSILLIFLSTQLHAGGKFNGPGQGSGLGPGPGPGYRNGEYMYQGGPENVYGVENLAYYGDWNSNRVFVINVDEMSLLEIVTDTGDGPYGVDQQDAETAYVLTRQTESLTVIDNYFIENIGRILLEHKPRSTNFNSNTGFSLVSGGDKVMTSLIKVNSDKVTKVFGNDLEVTPEDFGGSLATGHPLWVDEQHFFMLDRYARQIELWSRSQGRLSLLETPTSVHHVFQSPLEGFDDIYYAVVEGNQVYGISPSILRFKINDGQLEATGEAVLTDYDQAPDAFVMGSHHADFHPDGVHIYIGSYEGHVFVVNKDTMDIVKMIETGLGSGHTTFVPEHNRAFVTNHNSRYMTVINTLTHEKITDIVVAEDALPTYKSQAHTSGVSPDSEFFYSAASHDGMFFRVDVQTLDILRLPLGEDVNILMGSFIWNGEGDGM